MLTDEQIEILTDEYIIDLYQELEKDVIQDIARRVNKTTRLTETAEIMVKSMKEQGYDTSKIYSEVLNLLHAEEGYKKLVAENTYEYKQTIKEIIKETVKDAKKQGDELIAKAGDMSFNDDLEMWEQVGDTLSKPNTMNQLVSSFQKQTNGVLKNITKTTAFKGTNIGTVKLEDAYQKSLDVALLKTCSGTFSYDEACKHTIKELTKSGLRTVGYASGKTYQIDTAVRLAVRTGMSQLSGKIMEENCKTTGQDLVIISQHWGCRDTHVYFQNEIFSMSGKSKKYPHIEAPLGEGCAYGRPEGLKGPNCRHNFYPFWEGISEKPELIPEPEPKEYKGKTYDYYEATQKQRQMEREIRALKREKYISNDMEKMILENEIRQKTKEYKHFSEVMSIRPKENRLLGVGERSEYANKKALNRASVFKSVEDVKTVSKSKVLDMEKMTDITKHFADTHKIKLKGFENKKTNECNIVLSAVDDFLNKFPKVKSSINRIEYVPQMKNYGSMNDIGVMKIGKKGLLDYGTGLHESAHAMDFLFSDFNTHSFSEKVCTETRKRCKIKVNTKQYEKLSLEIIGVIEEIRKPEELFAYSVETEYGKGKNNVLSKTIVEVMEEMYHASVSK